MTAATTVPAGWTDEEHQRLTGLLEHADSVELKMTVPDADRYSAVTALEMDPLDASLVQIWFFDTPDLELEAAGVITRARRTKGRDDVTVKLRPVVPDQLPDDLRARSGFGVEIDALPGSFVCSARLKKKLEPGAVRTTIVGGKPHRRLFSKSQRAFFEQHAPNGLTLDDVHPLGPITALKLKFRPTDFDRHLVAELWMYPDGSRILELSTKCEPHEAFEVAAESRAFLESRGIDMTGVQQTKTKTALTYFAGELRNEDGDD